MADRGATTADVVVQRAHRVADGIVGPGERFVPWATGVGDGIEHWQLAEFSKARAGITTITVAMHALRDPADLRHRSAISAQASVFRSVAGTLTR